MAVRAPTAGSNAAPTQTTYQDPSTGQWYYYNAQTGGYVSAPDQATATASATATSGATLLSGAGSPYQAADGSWHYIAPNGQDIPEASQQAALSAAAVQSPDGNAFHGGANTTSTSPFTTANAENLVKQGATDGSKALQTVDPALGVGADVIKAISSGVGSLGGLGSAGSLPTGDRTALQAAIANTQNQSDWYSSLGANYQPVAAPVAQSPAAIQAAIAQQQAPIQAGLAQAQNATAAQIGSTTLAANAPSVQAQQIQAAQIAAAQQAQAGRVQGTQVPAAALASMTQLAPTALAQTAQIDPSQQAQFRAQQQGLAGSLQGTINGTTPSVAALMLRNATDNAVSNQYALAQAANGMSAGQAQRQAMLGAANLNSQSIYQQALLRAQEIATAQGQLGGVLDQGRSGDLSLATNQAGLTQQSNLANAGALNSASQAQLGADVQTKLTNAGATNQAQLAQAQINAGASQQQAALDTGTSQFNAGALNAQAQAQAQLQQAASLANQQSNLQAGTTNATLAQQVALANAGAQNTTNQQNAQLQQAAALQNSQLGTQASLANANNVTSANTASAQLANAVSLANANNQSQANLTTGQLQTQTALANANNQVSTNALNQKAVQDLASNQLTASGQNVTAANNQAQADVGLASAAAQEKGAELQAVGAGIGALSKLSDRREKRDISDSEKEIAAFVAGINPYAWRYKNPTLPGAGHGRQYGVMAQDLERTAVGKTMVRDRPDGRKEVDGATAATVALAAISALNKRLDRAGVR